MFTDPSEETFFLSAIRKTDRVLEFGSGYSTFQIAEIAREVISLEHDKYWYDKGRQVMPSNVTLILREPNIPYQEGSHCGTYLEFKDYIEEGKNHGIFDIIFIDGRARIECSKMCNQISHQDTLVFVHDFRGRFDSENYKEILNYLELVGEVGNMAKFRIKGK